MIHPFFLPGRIQVNWGMTNIVGHCRLCCLSKPLQDSHIIPKFVFDWMKETGLRFLRRPEQPNIRYQDGQRERLLCRACERLLNKDEKRFAEHVFRPFLKNSKLEMRYGEFLIRFSVSLCWRILVSEALSDRMHNAFDDRLSEAEVEWRNFLLGRQPLKKFDRFHVFLADILDARDQPTLNFNQYLTRFTDGCIAMSQSACAVYVKFSRFLFWAEITEYDQSKWLGTRIQNEGGILSTPQHVSDSRFGAFLLGRAKLASERYWLGLSERQKRRIDEAFRQNAVNLIGTDFWRSFQADMEANVDPHVWKTDKIEPNELCPCGSGETYNECHGKQ
jgi:hypothetical protein